MQKRVIALFVFLILSAFISVNFISAYTTNYSCNYVTVANCNASVGGNIVMGLSAANNAHGDFPYNASDNYPYVLCCYFGLGYTTCSPSYNLYYQTAGTNVPQNKIIGLTSPTNAHAEAPGQTAYTTPVCYQGLECVSTTAASGCSQLTWTYQNQLFYYNINVVNLSNYTNAHIGTGTGFNTSICCRVVGLNTACQLNSATWTYNNVMRGVQVGLNVTGTNCAGATITFNITGTKGNSYYPGDVTFPLNSPTISSIASTWAAGQPDSYKFTGKVTTNANSLVQSSPPNATLTVTQQPVGFCTSINTCGDYINQSTCNSDTSLCNVAQNSPNKDPNAYSYACTWNTTSNLCNFVNVYQSNGAVKCGNGFTLCTNQTSSLSYCYPGNTCPNSEVPTSNGNGVCDVGEGCSNIDCHNGDQDNCNLNGDGSVCQAGACYSTGTPLNITQCANGYTLCFNQPKDLTYCYPNDVCPTGDSTTNNSCSNSTVEATKNGLNPGSCLGDSVCSKTNLGGYCASPTASVGKCVYSFVNTGNTCADGFITYQWMATWTGNTHQPTNCISGQSVIECPAQIPLPLFTALNAVLAIVAIIIIYVIIIIVRKSKKHSVRSRKNRRRK